MADRQVTQSRKDSKGNITALCHSGKSWSPRLKRDAVQDINSGTHTYFVQLDGEERVDIKVVNGHLRTDPDKTTKNNLDDLPDC